MIFFLFYIYPLYWQLICVYKRCGIHITWRWSLQLCLMAFLIDHMFFLQWAIFLCYYQNTQWTVINHILAQGSEMTATAVECRFRHLWLLQLHNILTIDVLGVPSIQMTLLAHTTLYTRLFIRITTVPFIGLLKVSSEYLKQACFWRGKVTDVISLNLTTAKWTHEV